MNHEPLDAGSSACIVSHRALKMGSWFDELASHPEFHWSIRLKDGPDGLIGCIDLWPDDGKSRDMRGFWLDPEFQGCGLSTEAAGRVTYYAFTDLGWPHLWVSNAEANLASARIKEKQDARLVDFEPFRFVEGECRRIVWLIERQARSERPVPRIPRPFLAVGPTHVHPAKEKAVILR